ncbi:MAG: exosortase/archaeosortase family protein [Dysgonamonadaceae bacterium]|jgi:exosortase/archaeosortase family protein|nr:exosortase/archaeosortase family protein [Dysgonamonadaceae bacterium]
MRDKIKRFIKILKPYKGVLLFLFLLFFFHFSWKITIDGDMEGNTMYFLGKDVTPGWFLVVCHWLTVASAWVIHLFPNNGDLVTGINYLLFPVNNGWKINIVWGCIGIKQMSIFAGIILFYWGPFRKKIGYIFTGWTILTIYNIIRIALAVILTKGHAERFDFLHDGILRYIYYGIIFLLWVVWEEIIVNKNKLSWKSLIRIFKH